MAKYSCRFVNDVIFFGYWETGPCCVSLPKGNEAPRYQSVSTAQNESPESHARELLIKRDKLAHDMQRDSPPHACMQCRHLAVGERRKRLGRLRGVILSHAEACNLRCIYCYQTAPGYVRVGQQRYSPTATIAALVKLGAFAAERSAFWGGGEPVLSTSFGNDIQCLHELGFRQTVNSNCSVFSSELAELMHLDTGITVVCSVDAGGTSGYQRIKGRPLLGQVWKNICSYARVTDQVVLKFIVLPENTAR